MTLALAKECFLNGVLVCLSEAPNKAGVITGFSDCESIVYYRPVLRIESLVSDLAVYVG
jgi:hypothetical protein